MPETSLSARVFSLHAASRLPLAALSLLVGSVWSLGWTREHGTPRDIKTITSIVVHTVGGPICTREGIVFRPIPFRNDDAIAWRRYLLAAPVADAHYVIGRSGTVEPVLPISEVANHVVGANRFSIGIELVHRGDGTEPFDPRQIEALTSLIRRLRHDVPTIAFTNIVGHNDLDQRTCICNGMSFRRRQDPGANFPWAQVLAGVRQPNDPPRDKTTLTPLTGAASGPACPITDR